MRDSATSGYTTSRLPNTVASGNNDGSSGGPYRPLVRFSNRRTVMSPGIRGNHRDTGASGDRCFSPTGRSTTAAVNALVSLAIRNRILGSVCVFARTSAKPTAA